MGGVEAAGPPSLSPLGCWLQRLEPGCRWHQGRAGGTAPCLHSHSSADLAGSRASGVVTALQVPWHPAAPVRCAGDPRSPHVPADVPGAGPVLGWMCWWGLAVQAEAWLGDLHGAEPALPAPAPALSQALPSRGCRGWVCASADPGVPMAPSTGRAGSPSLDVPRGARRGGAASRVSPHRCRRTRRRRAHSKVQLWGAGPQACRAPPKPPPTYLQGRGRSLLALPSRP